MRRLKESLEARGPINVAIVGCGRMGTSLVSGLSQLEGFRPVVVSSRSLDKARVALGGLGLEDIRETRDRDEAQEALSQETLVLTDENSLAYSLEGIDCLVDCTGSPEAGVDLAYGALEAGVHVVSLNVECDVLVGHKLQAKAREAGLVYSLAAGDEPGAIMELYDFASFIGLEPLVLGKGKNNPLDHEATPETLKEEAQAKGVSPRMLTSFVDATNTMLELNVVANATGFVPDVRGCHGVTADHKTLPRVLSLKEEGGVLNSYGVLDFAQGVAPGVFALVRPKTPQAEEDLAYLSMGTGPNYPLYRPYHLTSLEVPISIAKAVLEKEETLSHQGPPIAQTIAVAKRDIKAGQSLEGIGSATVYGLLEKADLAETLGLIPISLLNERSVAREGIKKGQAIRMDQVDLDRGSFLYKYYLRD